MNERLRLRAYPLIGLLMLALLTLMLALLLAACGGGDDSASSSAPADDETVEEPTDEEAVEEATVEPTAAPKVTATRSAAAPTTRPATSPTTAAAAPTRAAAPQAATMTSWTTNVCGLARTLTTASEKFSAAINTTNYSAPDVKQKVLALYAQFALDLAKYRDGIAALPVPSAAGGKEARELWLSVVQLGIDQNASIVALAQALPAATFGTEYNDSFTDWRDSFGQGSLRADIYDLSEKQPAVNEIIETVYNTPGCADAVFE